MRSRAPPRAPWPSDDDLERLHDVVRAEWAEGRDRGVVGSPHFFVGDGGFFCPALDIARVDGHLRIATDQAAFDAFLERCLTA